MAAPRSVAPHPPATGAKDSGLGSRARPKDGRGFRLSEALADHSERPGPHVRLCLVPYQVLAQRWHDFYIIAGTAAATLVGLLFVGLSLHLRAVLSRSEVRSLARVTLANFGLILFVSLFMVIPQGSSSVSPELLGSGAFSLTVIVPSLLAASRSPTRTLRSYQLVLRFGFSALGYAGVIVAGVLLGSGSDDAALSWLVVVAIVLLVVSLRNSWDLLVSVGAALDGEPTGRPSSHRAEGQSGGSS
jgi:hypothetical protein